MKKFLLSLAPLLFSGRKAARYVLLLLGMLILLPGSEAAAREDFLFGQNRAAIERLPGVGPCSDGAADTLCRNNVPFGDMRWQQGFLFADNKLILSVLHGKGGAARLEAAQKTLAAYGYTLIFADSSEEGNETEKLDYLAVQREQGKEAANRELASLRQRGKENLEYVYVPQDVAKAATQSGEKLLLTAPADTVFAVVRTHGPQQGQGAQDKEHVDVEFCIPAQLDSALFSLPYPLPDHRDTTELEKAPSRE